MRLFKLFFLFVLGCLGLVMSACGSSGRENAVFPGSDTIRYASGFTVQHFDDYIQVDVRNPWDTARILQRYILVDSAFNRTSGIPQGVVVRVPVERVVVYNAVHCSMLDRLGVTRAVKGVCEPQYIKSQYVKRGIDEGFIVNLGEAHSPNIEAIMDLSPQVIVASPIKNQSYGTVAKLKTPIIECTDYMENTPLGQAEWIRFLALFFGKETLADSLFRETEQAYLDVKALAASAEYKPTVFSEMKIGSVWYTAGGESFMAHLFSDAGADYVWRDDRNTGSQPLSFEAVFDKAVDADFWLIKYNSAEPLTYGALKADYAPYAHFGAYRNRNIYVCNTGENDYYETLPQAPDQILKEFVAIFHPELLPGYAFQFYKKMEE